MSVEKINNVIGVGTDYLMNRKKDKQKFGVVVHKENVQSRPGQRLAVRRGLVFTGD